MTATTFPIRAADRDTGKELTLKITATSKAEAVAKAEREGWLVAGVDAQAAEAERTLMSDARQRTDTESLGDIRSELVALRKMLADSRFVKSPRSTIAEGIILSYFALIGLAVVAGIIYAVIAIAARGH